MSIEKTNLKYEVIKQQLCELFCAKNDFREHLKIPQDYYNPINETNYWCVTDAYIAVMIPQHLIGVAGNSDIPYGPVLNAFDKLTDPILFTFNEIRAGLSNFDSEPDYDRIYKTCNACNGEGECTCECCDDRHDCQKCDGEGEILASKTENGRLFYKNKLKNGPKQYYSIHGNLLDPNFISRICHGIKLMDLTRSIIQLTHHDPKRGSIFLVGEVMIMVAKCIPENYHEVKAVLPYVEQ